MSWEWWHEVSVWAGAIAIQAIVVRWWCVLHRKERWRAMYKRAYPCSLIVCGGYSFSWAIGYRHFDAYLSYALFDAVLVWSAISSVTCGIVARFLDRADRKREISDELS